MLTEWQTFLQSQGAHIENNNVLDFGEPAQEATVAIDGNIITDLSFLSVIKVTGTDATSFLHGQFSSDIQNMPEGSVQLSAWCNPKGQVILNFIITQLDDSFFLVCPEEMKEPFIKRLRMYVLRANVTIEDCSMSLPCIGIKQADDEAVNSSSLNQITTTGTAVRIGNLILLPIPHNNDRRLVIGPAKSLQETWSELSPEFTPVGSDYWRLFDILDGLPWVLATTTESFLPQLLNMDQLQAVSFNKGCFPGQEVVARLQHRGKVKQRLLIATVENGTDITPGANIYQDGDGQSAGTIINIANHPGEGLFALVVLDIDHGSPNQLHLKNNNARFIRISPPSYLMLP